jgi:hypothetical protein
MRPLSKSRFKLALQCPTNLFYTGKTEYENADAMDPFLEALAEGGYQVGELAKCYYPGGHMIEELGYELPLQKTNELLKQENVVIYEAAIQYKDFFVRVDVLEKKGDLIRMIEVKSKSFRGNDADDFLDANGFLSGGWAAYLEDVAFQKYVVQKAFPQWKVKAFLMLADKNKKATVNGLNQKFQLSRDADGRIKATQHGDTSLNALGEKVLTEIDVDRLANSIINDDAYAEPPEIPYEEKLSNLAVHYKNDKKIISQVGLHCFSCEFNANGQGQKSGFKECWSHFYNWTEEQYQQPKITEIWNFRRKQQLFNEGVIFIDDVLPEHIGGVQMKADGTLSAKERQWMQVEKTQNNDDTFYFDADGFKDAIKNYTYPLHFIDFETSMVAIPFYKGQQPYEQIAFQFSHHVIREDGSIEHIGQFIETEKGKFPNFDFVRALKKDLEQDNGTIFRYAAHENTVLNQVCAQLYEINEKEVPDKDELIQFIHSITYKKDENRVGERNMVDMLQLVKAYFYDPRMGGSNSIKAVLPAVLSRSKYIRNKYSKPIYGKTSTIKSLNFEDGWIWIQKDETGKIISPYKLLPPLFEDIDQKTAENFITSDSLADGGAAMTAFSKMQFTQITELERQKIIEGLLKYCELDTLAMVMIWEFWESELQYLGPP